MCLTEAINFLRSFELKGWGVPAMFGTDDFEFSIKLAEVVSKYEMDHALIIGNGLSVFPFLLALMGREVVFLNLDGHIHREMAILERKITDKLKKNGSELKLRFRSIQAEIGALKHRLKDLSLQRDSFDLVTFVDLVGNDIPRGKLQEWLLTANALLGPTGYLVIDESPPISGETGESLLDLLPKTFPSHQLLEDGAYFKGLYEKFPQNRLYRVRKESGEEKRDSHPEGRQTPSSPNRAEVRGGEELAEEILGKMREIPSYEALTGLGRELKGRVDRGEVEAGYLGETLAEISNQSGKEMTSWKMTLKLAILALVDLLPEEVKQSYERQSSEIEMNRHPERFETEAEITDPNGIHIRPSATIVTFIWDLERRLGSHGLRGIYFERLKTGELRRIRNVNDLAGFGLAQGEKVKIIVVGDGNPKVLEMAGQLLRKLIGEFDLETDVSEDYRTEIETFLTTIEGEKRSEIRDLAELVALFFTGGILPFAAHERLIQRGRVIYEKLIKRWLGRARKRGQSPFPPKAYPPLADRGQAKAQTAERKQQFFRTTPSLGQVRAQNPSFVDPAIELQLLRSA